MINNNDLIDSNTDNDGNDCYRHNKVSLPLHQQNHTYSIDDTIMTILITVVFIIAMIITIINIIIMITDITIQMSLF